MKYILMMLMLLPLNLWAAWDVELGLGIDGETWKIEHQKFEDGKEQSVNMGNYILKMTIKKSKIETGLDVLYTLHEKKGVELILITKGDEVIEQKLKKDIYAKGEEKQPNTIITLKLKNL
jgi:hypothetical protein